MSLHYDDAAKLRDGLREIQESWVWVNFILPYLEKTCADLMESALEPGPDHHSHASARYRLAELRAFQQYLINLEANASETAVAGDPSLLDRGPGAGEEGGAGREGDEEIPPTSF